jgi:hypothetical protein
MYLQTSWSMIEHLIPILLFTFVTYVYLYYHVVEINNLIC